MGETDQARAASRARRAKALLAAHDSACRVKRLLLTLAHEVAAPDSVSSTTAGAVAGSDSPFTTGRASFSLTRPSDGGLSIEGLGQVVLEAHRVGTSIDGVETEAAVRRAVRGLLLGAQARVASSAVPIAPVLVSIVSLADGCIGGGIGIGGGSGGNSSHLRALVDAVDFVEFSLFIVEVEGGKQWRDLPSHEVYRW